MLRNRELRRVLLAFAGFNAAEWGTWIAILVFAFDQGGATAAGLVALAQLVPAALVAPFAAGGADRYRPARVLVAGYVVQTSAYGVTGAAMLLDADQLVVYACAAVAASAITITRPTQAALAPALARTPDQLTAVNVVSGWIESMSVLVAPALTGVLLAVGETGTVLVAAAVVSAASGLLVRPVEGPPPGAAHAAGDTPLTEAMAGFRIIRDEPEPRLLVLLLAAQFVAIGALDVLYVVLAIDVLGEGESWAGYLNAAFGAGGVLAIGATALLVGRRHLAPAVLVGAGVWLAAFVALATVPRVGSALALLAVAGAGRLLLDVAGRTLLQRTGPPEFLSRVFGVLEGLTMAALAIGSLLTPLLVALGGGRAAIVGVGAVLPVVALLMGRKLLRIDAERTVPVVEISLLRSMPLFAGLPPPELEALARALEPRRVSSGDTVIREGEVGDLFYAIGDGSYEVSAERLVLAELTRGDGFGEIALLREVPRTATVTALCDGLLYVLEKDAFLTAVAGYGAVQELADDRLEDRASRLGSRS